MTSGFKEMYFDKLEFEAKKSIPLIYVCRFMSADRN